MPELTVRKPRPIWYNINLLNLPVPGIVSIFHRICGLLLTLAIIGLLYCLDGSLKSEVDFGQIRGGLSHPLVKLVALGFMWSFLHHFCAGIRFLFLDLGGPTADRGRKLGQDRRQGEASARQGTCTGAAPAWHLAGSGVPYSL